MSRRSRGCGFIFFLVIGFVLAAGPPLVLAQADLLVIVSGFKNSQGSAMIGVYDSADGFPDQAGAAWGTREKISGSTAQAVFPGLVDGWYAVAVFHDENNNDRLDKNLLGLPKEAYGFSNNVRGVTGPPSFTDARFQLTTPKKTIRIKVK